MDSSTAKSNIRLLLLANNEANRLVCKHALSQHQDCAFVIFEAETSCQDLKMARARQTDCILLDQHLTDMQGAEFLSQLAEYSPERTLPVIMLSAPDARATHKSRTGSFLIKISDTNLMKELSAEVLWAILEQQAMQETSNTLDKLRESEAKYRNLVQQLPVITYIASLETPGKLLYVSPQISQLGYPAEDWLEDSDRLLKRVHQDDLSITIEAYAHTYEHHAPLRCEYRLVDNKGISRWFLDEANIVRDESGESLFLQGVLVDISKDKETEQELCFYRQRLEELVVQRTQQLEKQCEILRSANANLDQALIALKQSNSELRNSETRFRLLLESAGEGIIGLDGAGSCTFVNQSALAMLGYAEDEVLGQDIPAMLDSMTSPELIHPKEEPWLENLFGDSSNPSNIQIFLRKDGGRFLVECASYPIECNGATDGSVLVFRDVTEFQAQFRKLAYRASHDPLTGLINRSEFERRLIRVLAGMHSGEKEHVLCFLDLDHFKDINDTYGHAAGDRVLSSFGALLASKIRQRDTLARLGGDEFALLLEHTTLDQAYGITNELCDCLRNMRLTWAGQEFSVYASIGITALTHTDRDIASALCHADAACYEAKKKGRNQIHVFNCPHNAIESPVLNS
ncbi:MULTISPECIES: GGDEF domain-containing protein [Methylomonas]|uniref:Diguanylate cyclase n=2 Tax=Methylomonas TaxID=416 RepID=A0A140E6R2_9GAMM|nr:MULTISPECIES: GGDEF domain-containing protein [Methylomonas]AMK79086.1 hypothetical protein JT25_021815 [Methylomonas denitrificans]OAH99591.1 hypothetical protein A1342_07650 [Methylomonas methanica]TCV78205.1 PAS domain S-box-containing protein/diguanylate cyclase (GGDEF)-like protein [Methylomonas methanica]